MWSTARVSPKLLQRSRNSIRGETEGWEVGHSECTISQHFRILHFRCNRIIAPVQAPWLVAAVGATACGVCGLTIADLGSAAILGEVWVRRVLVWANSEALRLKAFLVAENLWRCSVGTRSAGRQFWICEHVQHGDIRHMVLQQVGQVSTPALPVPNDGWLVRSARVQFLSH